MGKGLTLFLVAGEPSGDRLGAALMAGMKSLVPGVAFAGVAGPLMQAEGMESLFPMEELSVMGIAEVLPKYLHLKRRIAEVAAAVVASDAVALVTIDSPDFGLRVAALVKAAKPSVRTIHYVAPSVWAWAWTRWTTATCATWCRPYRRQPRRPGVDPRLEQVVVGGPVAQRAVVRTRPDVRMDRQAQHDGVAAAVVDHGGPLRRHFVVAAACSKSDKKSTTSSGAKSIGSMASSGEPRQPRELTRGPPRKISPPPSSTNPR